MKYSLCLVGIVAAFAGSALPSAIPDQREVTAACSAPVSISATISSGRIRGKRNGDVEYFNGIPYADPPIGPLRLKPPRNLTKHLGDFDATAEAAACPQSKSSSNGWYNAIIENLPFSIGGADASQFVRVQQEDCLTVSVHRPAGTRAGDRLPVLFWIYGGAFEFGSTTAYDPRDYITFASRQGKPVVVVAVNYRLGAFGFLGGAEVLKDGSTNLGLLDQRLGLKWVADNIDAFGGDPDKVTIWGESAGSISVMDQMLLFGGNATYKGKALFRGSIMNSGSAYAADKVDCPKAQSVYNQVVEKSGCKNATDTLTCLREVDYNVLLAASQSLATFGSYSSLALSFMPRPDGKVLPDSTEELLKKGAYHSVPMIIGHQAEEGTVFALAQTDLSTVEDVVDYLSKYMFHRANKSQVRDFVNFYKPFFGTNATNMPYPAFQALSQLLGDYAFIMARRNVLELTTKLHPNISAWSYQASYLDYVPIVGTFHGSDVLATFYGRVPGLPTTSTRMFYNNFIYNLDPNVGDDGGLAWPLWSKNKQLMVFGASTNSLLQDEFRQNVSDWISKHKDILML